MKNRSLKTAILSIVLCVAVCLSALPAFVSAATLSPANGSPLTIDTANGYILGVSAGTTVDTLFTNFKEATSRLSATDKNGIDISGNELISTGDTVSIGGTAFTVIAGGDLDGDGVINSNDAFAIKQAIRKKAELSEFSEKAADIDGNGSVNTLDYIKVKLFVAGFSNQIYDDETPTLPKGYSGLTAVESVQAGKKYVIVNKATGRVLTNTIEAGTHWYEGLGAQNHVLLGDEPVYGADTWSFVSYDDGFAMLSPNGGYLSPNSVNAGYYDTYQWITPIHVVYNETEEAFQIYRMSDEGDVQYKLVACNDLNGNYNYAIGCHNSDFDAYSYWEIYEETPLKLSAVSEVEIGKDYVFVNKTTGAALTRTKGTDSTTGVAYLLAEGEPTVNSEAFRFLPYNDGYGIQYNYEDGYVVPNTTSIGFSKYLEWTTPVYAEYDKTQAAFQIYRLGSDGGKYKLVVSSDSSGNYVRTIGTSGTELDAYSYWELYEIVSIETFVESGTEVELSSSLEQLSLNTNYDLLPVLNNSFDLLTNASVIDDNGAKFISDTDQTSAAIKLLRAETDKRIEEILSSPSMPITSGAKVYYVSNSGSDSNDGLSPSTAWASLAKVNTVTGSSSYDTYVLFERGGLWRGQITASRYVTYSAYGVGDKPKIYRSPFNGGGSNFVSKWTKHSGNIWVLKDSRLNNDIGTVVFNSGEANAIKKPFLSDLTSDLYFYHDYANTSLYVYSVENPAERFYSIEFNLYGNVITVRVNDVTIDNLCIKYCGSHGVGAPSVNDLIVQNCEFGWIGGAYQQPDVAADDPYTKTRYGNAVEIYGTCTNFQAIDNYVYQVYDAGLTQQINLSEGASGVQKNVLYSGNVIEYCAYSIEYWITSSDTTDGYMDTFLIEDNYMWYAGRGLSEQRHNGGNGSHINGWRFSDRNRALNYAIRNNVMIDSKDVMINIYTPRYNPDGSDSMPIFNNNIIFANSATGFGIVEQGKYINTSWPLTVKFDENLLNYVDAPLYGDVFGYISDSFYSNGSMVTTVEPDYELKSVTAVEAGKDYVIVNKNTGKVLTNSIEKGSHWYESLGEQNHVLLGDAPNADSDKWRFVSYDDGYAITYHGGTYLSPNTVNAGIYDTYQNITPVHAVYNETEKAFQIYRMSDAGDVQYKLVACKDLSGDYVYAIGCHNSDFDAYSYWELYEVVKADTTAEPDDSGDSGTGDSGDSGIGDSGDSGTGDSGDSGTGDSGDSGTGDSGDSGTGDSGDSTTESPAYVLQPVTAIETGREYVIVNKTTGTVLSNTIEADYHWYEALGQQNHVVLGSAPTVDSDKWRFISYDDGYAILHPDGSYLSPNSVNVGFYDTYQWITPVYAVYNQTEAAFQIYRMDDTGATQYKLVACTDLDGNYVYAIGCHNSDFDAYSYWEICEVVRVVDPNAPTLEGLTPVTSVTTGKDYVFVNKATGTYLTNTVEKGSHWYASLGEQNHVLLGEGPNAYADKWSFTSFDDGYAMVHPAGGYLSINTVNAGIISDYTWGTPVHLEFNATEGAFQIYRMDDAGTTKYKLVACSDLNGNYVYAIGCHNSDFDAYSYWEVYEVSSDFAEENLSFQNLTNTVAKIKNGEALNITFMGGSITDGAGATNQQENGWPRLVCNWLSNEYNITVNENRKSIGGTGSYLGAMRFTTDVISTAEQTPDILFIEYAVNDSYLKYTYDQSVRYVESIIRKAYQVNPNVEIIIVLSFDVHLATSDFTQLTALRDVAAKYGLASIKISDKFYEIVSANGGTVTDYLSDNVHPNDAGYEIYAQIITERLAEMITAAEEEYAQSGSTEYVCTAKKLPAASMSNYFRNPTMVYPAAVDRSASTGWEYNSGQFSWLQKARFPGYLTASTSGSKLVFEFVGTEIGMLYNMGTDKGAVSIYVDGTHVKDIDAYLSYTNPREAVIAENLTNGSHTVEIVLNENAAFDIGALLYS